MISIITALYKSERYLPDYLRSLKIIVNGLIQKEVPFEVVILPTAPSEQEKRLLEPLSHKTWCRIQEVKQRGLYVAWNMGVEFAQGDTIGFWNVDDRRYLEGLLEALNLIQKGADLVYQPFRIRRYITIFDFDMLVHVQLISKQVPEFNEETYPRFLREMHCGPFFVFRKELYNQVGPFDEQFKIVADFDWCIRAAKISKKIVRGHQLAGSFRLDGRGLSAGGSPRHMAENNIVYMRHAAEDKIIPASQQLMESYQPYFIFFRNNKIPIDRARMVFEHY